MSGHAPNIESAYKGSGVHCAFELNTNNPVVKRVLMAQKFPSKANESIKYWNSLNQAKKDNFLFVLVSTDEVYGTLGETGHLNHVRACNLDVLRKLPMKKIGLTARI